MVMMRVAPLTTLPLHSFLFAMEPANDLEEEPRKVVGKIKRRTPAEAVEWMVRQFHAMGLKLPYPKGVYRFEEANEWEMKHQIAEAVKRLRDHQR